MITVRAVRCFIGAAGKAVDIGERLTLPDADAHYLLGLGRVEVVISHPDDGAPVAQHADPSVTRTRSRR